MHKHINEYEVILSTLVHTNFIMFFQFGNLLVYFNGIFEGEYNEKVGWFVLVLKKNLTRLGNFIDYVQLFYLFFWSYMLKANTKVEYM